MALGASFAGIYIPLNLIFDLSEFSWLNNINSIVAVIFIVDVVVDLVRFQIQTKDTNPFIAKPTLRKFLPGFLLDIVAAIPYVLLFGGGGIQLLKLTKFIKVGQFMHYIRQREVKMAQVLSLQFFFSRL